MKEDRVRVICLVALLSVAPLAADTVFFTNDASINGRVTYENSQFRIVSRFEGKEADPKTVGRNNVRKVELNDVVDNPGPEPPWLKGLGPESLPGQPDELDLAKGDKIVGVLDGMDATYVRMRARAPVPRVQVLSIRVGARR